jgi:hypothetical protein
MAKTRLTIGVIGPIAVLLGSVALGLGIRAVRVWQGAAPTRIEAEQRMDPTEPQPVRADARTREAGRMPADTEEPNTATADETEEPPTESDLEHQEQSEHESEDIPDDETITSEPPTVATLGAWREVWADLNLTEEEQARLREGFRLAMEKWRRMSEEERQAETVRWREIGARWESMSESERLEVSRRIRERFEQWRRSGQVELPQLSLD